VNVFKRERFLVQCRRGLVALVLPGGYVAIMLIVAASFAIGSLLLFSQMAATRLVSVQRINAHKFAQF
jgi:hypothetical protein